MPELPEVQTIVNDLQSIVGQAITGFWTDFAKGLKSEDFEKKILNKKITSIYRSGKNIIIKLSNHSAIVVHLKMTGQLLLKISNLKPCLPAGRSKISKSNLTEKYDKHIHHVFYLDNNYSLNFSDIRKFGTLELVDDQALEKKTSAKGIDPFAKEFTLKKFVELKNKYGNKNLKQFLMDQSIVSGIGNIYASEIPFDAKINPSRKMLSLSKEESTILFRSITKILKKAIQLRGTSFSDYRDSSGKKGAFQNFLQVYKRNGQNCKRCATIVRKIVIGQRSTFYCPGCQK